MYQFLQFNCSTGITSQNLFIMSQVEQHDILMKKPLWWKYFSEENDFVIILFRICLYCYECLRCYVIYENKNFTSLFYSYVKNNVNNSEKDTHSCCICFKSSLPSCNSTATGNRPFLILMFLSSCRLKVKLYGSIPIRSCLERLQIFLWIQVYFLYTVRQ